MECPSGSHRFAVGEASHYVRSLNIWDCCAGEAACAPSIGSPSQAFSQELTSSAHPCWMCQLTRRCQNRRNPRASWAIPKFLIHKIVSRTKWQFQAIVLGGYLLTVMTDSWNRIRLFWLMYASLYQIISDNPSGRILFTLIMIHQQLSVSHQL